MHDPIETKLAAARTRLILDKPFLGALVMRLPMHAADPKWCPTTATDARSFYYNRDYIQALGLDQAQFVLAHEALHCALSHFARREHRIKSRWDIACDYAINPLLVNDGLTPPPGALIEDSFAGMTAEEIYPYIDESNTDEPLDKHLYDSEEKRREGSQTTGNTPQDNEQGDTSSQGKPSEGNDRSRSGQQAEPDQHTGGTPQPPPLTARERETLAVQWQQRLAGAAQTALQAGKLGGSLARMVEHLLQPQLPWRMLLARYMTGIARDDYSYMRPSRRREGNAIMPNLRSTQVDVVVALDTSGSISSAEIDEFLAEVNAIKGQLRARITLLACDAALAPESPWIFETWEEFKRPRYYKGGGGTSFRPVFEWVSRQGTEPNLLVYFTDADGEFPAIEPHFPVLWLVKGKRKVPWGQRIQLN